MVLFKYIMVCVDCHPIHKQFCVGCQTMNQISWALGRIQNLKKTLACFFLIGVWTKGIGEFVQKVVDTSKSSKITPHHNLFNYCMGSTWCSKVVKTDFARSYSQTHPNDRFAYSPVKTRRKAAWMSSGHWPRLLRFSVVKVLLCHTNQCVLVWLPIYIYHHLSTSWKSRLDIQVLGL